MKRIQKVSLILCLLSFQIIFAQTDSAERYKLKIKIGITYNSALNYFGRIDSIKSTGIFPQVELWISKNFYASATPVFINNAVQTMDYSGTVLSTGYFHTTDKWITNLYLLKPFYKQNIRLMQSALKAQTGLSISALTHALNFTFGGDVKFSDKIDFGATAGVDHLVRKEFESKSVLVIDPSIYVYAGSQNFSSSYYKNKAGLLVLPGSTEQINKNVTKFNILAYEFSVPVVYAKGKFMALLTPSFIIPQNLVTGSGNIDVSESGENMLYTTIGFKYSF